LNFEMTLFLLKYLSSSHLAKVESVHYNKLEYLFGSQNMNAVILG
jgi:hypothetical protein